MERRMEPAEILDWYDGIVIGVVRLSWQEGLFLASLLSWSQEDRRRALALLRIDEAELDRIRQVAAGGWPNLLAHLRDLCSRAAGEAIVAVLDEGNGAIVSATAVPVGSIREYMMGDVERSLEPERRKWLLSSG